MPQGQNISLSCLAPNSTPSVLYTAKSKRVEPYLNAPFTHSRLRQINKSEIPALTHLKPCVHLNRPTSNKVANGVLRRAVKAFFTFKISCGFTVQAWIQNIGWHFLYVHNKGGPFPVALCTTLTTAQPHYVEISYIGLDTDRRTNVGSTSGNSFEPLSKVWPSHSHFHGGHASLITFCRERLCRISSKSDKQFDRWYWILIMVVVST